MLTAATFQYIAAVFGAMTAIFVFVGTIKNYPKLTVWFKKREQLVAERNVAIAHFQAMSVHFEEARTSVIDLKTSLDAVRVTNTEISIRLKELESMRPLYDAAMIWIPRAFEYIGWIEKIAKMNNFDLGGRELPALPVILVDYFTRLGR